MGIYSALKEECLAANLLLSKYKLIDLTFGNVSVIDHDKGVFAIKPSGVDYQSLTADQIVVMDLAGNRIEGTLKPSSDEPTHRRLFQAFGQQSKNMRAVVHTHSRNAVAFAQAGLPIPCLGTTHADYFCGDIPVTRPLITKEVEGAYEWETGNVIVERFTQLDPDKICAVLVHSHGPFIWGSSGAKAVENALALEIVAEMALKAIQLNPEVRPIPEHLKGRHYNRKHGPHSYYGQASEVVLIRDHDFHA